jgi:hypothetical protein
LLTCCRAAEHPWDRFKVDLFWRPRQLRCLIIGENPGDVESAYFYEAPGGYANDPVVVRRYLLRGLLGQKLLISATLEGFRDAGFLFDHAIRCPLSSVDVKKERSAAMRYASSRVQRSAPLLAPLSQPPVVWVMGQLANNAMEQRTMARNLRGFRTVRSDKRCLLTKWPNSPFHLNTACQGVSKYL